MAKRVVLVTGGTSGIGHAAAKMFLAEKDTLAVLVGRSPERGQTAIKKMPAPERAFFLRGDVSRPTECRRIVGETVARFGRLDVLVNSAGIYLEKAIDDTGADEFATIMGTNVGGTYFMAKHALPELKKTKGCIVNVSSDAGLHANYFCTAYCAAKGAVTMFTRALAVEAAPFGVRVNCVCPGDIMTPMTERQLAGATDRKAALKEMASVYPLGRLGTADEAAAVIVFLASSAAAFVTGAAWSVDGGLTA